MNKKDYKAIFIIHRCVDPNNFEKVRDFESSKEAWNILEKLFDGAKKVKEVRLRTHNMSCIRWNKMKAYVTSLQGWLGW